MNLWQNLTEHAQTILGGALAIAVLYEAITGKVINALKNRFNFKRDVKESKKKDVSDEFDIKNKELEWIKNVQDYYKKQLEDALLQADQMRERAKKQAELYNRELDVLQAECREHKLKAQAELDQYRSLLKRYKAHIKYQESLLKNNGIEFFPLTDGLH